MQTWTFPAVFDRHADGEIVVGFPDIPGVSTGAYDLDEARNLAEHALEEAILFLIESGQPIPAPRGAGPGEEAVTLAPAAAARAMLVRAMAEQNLTKVGLAARLGKDEKAVRRMLSRKGASLDQVFDALRELGEKVALSTAA